MIRLRLLVLLNCFLAMMPARAVLFEGDELWDKDADKTPADSLITREYHLSRELQTKVANLHRPPPAPPGYIVEYGGGFVALTFPTGRLEMFSKATSTLVVKATAKEHQRIKQALEDLVHAKPPAKAAPAK